VRDADGMARFAHGQALTGGHVEPDDADPWETVQRECPEELFIEAQPMEATKTRPREHRLEDAGTSADRGGVAAAVGEQPLATGR
jgi:8-oxo-dGTP pyrophosphatase MutT (NUDIX family)